MSIGRTSRPLALVAVIAILGLLWSLFPAPGDGAAAAADLAPTFLDWEGPAHDDGLSHYVVRVETATIELFLLGPVAKALGSGAS